MSAGGTLVASGLGYRYGRVDALRAIDLTIESGEFVTLLGPSGCGKTTLLRLVAGFLKPTSGSLSLDARDLAGVPPNKRPVNMVFQRPTLFPHLNVADNVAFGLRLSRVSRNETRRRVGEALSLVRLEGYETRRNFELSGGQMQRVALARALVNEPKVLLLDEPFSALDLKIRLELEVELRRVHRETGATFVHVTHDQREALALSDRIAIFADGHIEQIGDPQDVYRRPRTPYVAGFVGDANVLPVEVSRNGAAPRMTVAATELVAPDAAQPGAGWLVVRSESVRLVTGGDGLRGVVRDVAFRGSGFAYRIDVDGLDEPVKAEVAADGQAIAVGTAVCVAWDPAAATLLRDV